MIIYFSGTGNSRIIAERIGEIMCDDVFNSFESIRERKNETLYSEKAWVFVAPTYAWRLPRIFEDFIRNTSFTGAEEAYFVMTCGDDIGNAEAYIRKLCHTKGFTFMGVKDVIMPENYTALFDCPSQEEVNQIMKNALETTDGISENIREGRKLFSHKAGFADKIKSNVVNGPFYAMFVKAKKFEADASCTGCGLCEKRCPMGNISVKDVPKWGNRCTHCMACINGCPELAVSYGRASDGRYHIYDGVSREKKKDV